MRILLINNNTKHLSRVQSSLLGHDIEVQKYRPGLDFHWQDKDVVVLSGGGGEGREANDIHRQGKLWYEDEMKFILACKKPIVGICMGFEIIAQAYGAEVKELGELVSGFNDVHITGAGLTKFPVGKLSQMEAHRFHVPAVAGKQFEVLGDSKTGIEIIKHTRRPIVATQFHPEAFGGTLNLDRFMSEAMSMAK